MLLLLILPHRTWGRTRRWLMIIRHGIPWTRTSMVGWCHEKLGRPRVVRRWNLWLRGRRVSWYCVRKGGMTIAPRMRSSIRTILIMLRSGDRRMRCPAKSWRSIHWSWASISGHLWHRWVRGTYHRRPRDGRYTRFVNSGFRIHALLRSDLAQSWIAGWTDEPLRILMWPRVVADKVEVISCWRCDTERLLHQSVRFVAITILIIFPTSHLQIRVATASTLRRFPSS